MRYSCEKGGVHHIRENFFFCQLITERHAQQLLFSLPLPTPGRSVMLPSTQPTLTTLRVHSTRLTSAACRRSLGSLKRGQEDPSFFPAENVWRGDSSLRPQSGPPSPPTAAASRVISGPRTRSGLKQTMTIGVRGGRRGVTSACEHDSCLPAPYPTYPPASILRRPPEKYDHKTAPPGRRSENSFIASFSNTSLPELD